MSLVFLKDVFKNLESCKTWSIQLLRIKTSKRHGTSYVGREITLKPAGKLNELISEISSFYIQESKGKLVEYTDVRDYDGTVIGNTIYKLKKEYSLIKEEYETLLQAIALPDIELDPFKFNAQAYLIKGVIEILDEEYPVKLISMQKPFTNFKHKFFKNNGVFEAAEDKVLSLRTAIDLMVIGDNIYMFNLSGEKLFNMERAYKIACAERLEEIKQSDIMTDMELFVTIANSGHNPRRFVSYEKRRLEILENREKRLEMANKFGIPLEDDKFDTTKEGVSEKIVKLLCQKGMIDPLEETPVEVAGVKRWS